jgi:hypothetical protein
MITDWEVALWLVVVPKIEKSVHCQNNTKCKSIIILCLVEHPKRDPNNEAYQI